MSQNNNYQQENPVSLRMIRWNMADIPQVPFPEGYSARAMRLDEADVWMDIIRDSKATSAVPRDRFISEFGHDLESVEKRCFFIIDPSGKAVGTISSWYHELNGKECGLIHWVGVLPEYQGLGLGKASLTYALNRMAEWHDCCFLHTSSEKVPAVCLYLSFGFEPDLSIPACLEGWRYIKRVSHHPALDKYDL